MHLAPNIPAVPLLAQSDTDRFLLVIAGTSLVTVQIFDDTGAMRRNLNHMIHGWTRFNAAPLRKLNDRGACVVFMANDGAERAVAIVIGVRALVVDLDRAHLIL